MDATAKDEATHRKRLGQILRYIANMHQSLDGGGGGVNDSSGSFLQPVDQSSSNKKPAPLFFQGRNNSDDDCDSVLFSTDNFRNLLTVESDPLLFDCPPFSFYASPSSHHDQSPRSQASKKRSLTGTIKNSLFSSSDESMGNPCWFRITRLTNAQVSAPPVATHPEVTRYLEEWLAQTPQASSIAYLLSNGQRLHQAPKIPPHQISSSGGRAIQTFLRQYKKYVRRKMYQSQLEPIYNRLFDWVQNQLGNSHELVWGLGHASQLFLPLDNVDDDAMLLNGPILEVLVEVELARDGALLIRPREHTSVALNRSVVAALSRNGGTSSSLAAQQQLHRAVADLDPLQMSPGQPQTYIPLLKRFAVELSPGGMFQLSATTTVTTTDQTQLVVTEAWCLYARPKPSSVWARDATAFADQLMSTAGQPEKFGIPKATWALTHGPSSLDYRRLENSPKTDTNGGLFQWINTRFLTKQEVDVVEIKPLFPLASTDAQSRIAELLLSKQYPAVVCEGPPGTGKTQTIANMICAYLCRGKRVLVTSKNAPALSVVRSRLPLAVQELCVDVSMSESTGVRQLQQTVERLSNRLTSSNSDLNQQRHIYLQVRRRVRNQVLNSITVISFVTCSILLFRVWNAQKNIEAHEKELLDIDETIKIHSESIRQLVQHQDGQEMVNKSIELIEEMPWLMAAIAPLSLHEVLSLHDRIGAFMFETDDPAIDVTGFSLPISSSLVSIASSNAGNHTSRISTFAQNAIAALPAIGTLSGMQQHARELQEAVSKLRINNAVPTSLHDWVVISRALRKRQTMHIFDHEVWQLYQRKYTWPDPIFLQSNCRVQALHSNVKKAVSIKQLGVKLNVENLIGMTVHCRMLDAKRSVISVRIQSLAEELVSSTVVSELSRSFSDEAHSALIRFSQIAGKSKFNKSQQPSKMTQRQRRRRQDYLDAFDQCCRFIPCWILTTSQISDFLPPECLFDLVINDESSQSDVTVLPGMLRGRQWLIVGDGKQVSPTESFVSEEQIESLRAALPACSLETALLPGQSFFDLCAQAFPSGRVSFFEFVFLFACDSPFPILLHFRCASEIIAFSNSQFYDNQLVPLRLPMKSERISPSIVDVRVRNGVKQGKTNDKEADEIVRRVRAIAVDPLMFQRTIGVISLLGDEQSRLIRGRLLDALGPHLMARHEVLVGDPPAFQGAERDGTFESTWTRCLTYSRRSQNILLRRFACAVIFLSMVCSRGKSPTQSQLFHFQRANVAMSRARDQCVLVRSLEISDVPNLDDAKIPIIDFFVSRAMDSVDGECAAGVRIERSHPAQCLLDNLLTERGYIVRSMGVVWTAGICVEHPESDLRAALMVDCLEDTHEDWYSSYRQQKAIERVGWKCLRVGVFSLLTDWKATINSVIEFLAATGVVAPTRLYDELPVPEDITVDDETESFQERQNDAPVVEQIDAIGHAAAPDPLAVVFISSDDEDKPVAKIVQPDQVLSANLFADTDDSIQASNFGNVVDLTFLRGLSNVSFRQRDDDFSGHCDGTASRNTRRRKGKHRNLDLDLDADSVQGRNCSANDDEKEYLVDSDNDPSYNEHDKG